MFYQDTKNFNDCLLSGESALLLKVQAIVEERSFQIADTILSEDHAELKNDKSLLIKKSLEECNSLNEVITRYEDEEYRSIRATCSLIGKKTIYQYDDEICKTRNNYQCRISKRLRELKSK